jgi:hypothetical protein
VLHGVVADDLWLVGCVEQTDELAGEALGIGLVGVDHDHDVISEDIPVLREFAGGRGFFQELVEETEFRLAAAIDQDVAKLIDADLVRLASIC